MSPTVPVILQPLKVAMPLAAETGLDGQEKVPVPLANARVTCAEDEVAVFPPESAMVMTGWVLKADPLAAPAGCTVTTSCVAAPAVNEKLEEVAPLSPLLVALRE